MYSSQLRPTWPSRAHTIAWAVGVNTCQVPETQLQGFPLTLPTIYLLGSVIGGFASCRPLPQPTPASQNSVTLKGRAL